MLSITYSLYSNNSILHPMSTFHLIINITENIRKRLIDGNVCCGVFAGLQEAFDTVHHHILLANRIITGFMEIQITH